MKFAAQYPATEEFNAIHPSEQFLHTTLWNIQSVFYVLILAREFSGKKNF